MDSKIGAIILLFVGIIVVLAILPTIADNTTLMTTKSVISRETTTIPRNTTGGINSSYVITVAQAPVAGDWQYVGGTRDCGLGILNVTTNNGTLCVANTDYVWIPVNGTLRFYETGRINNTGSNTSFVSYDYCDDAYVGDQAAGTVTGLIIVFAALGLFGFVIYYFWKEIGDWS